MKKTIIFLLLCTSMSASAQWLGVTGTTQKNTTTGLFRWNFGTGGLFYPANKTGEPGYIQNQNTLQTSANINIDGIISNSEYNLYGTSDRNVNYERLRSYFTASPTPGLNFFNINTENAGTGIKRVLAIGVGGAAGFPSTDIAQSYTLFNTNPAIAGAANGYGMTTVKTAVNQPVVVGMQAFTKASYTSSTAQQGVIGGGFTTFVAGSNTVNWATTSNQHPNIQGLSSVVGQSIGATGSIPKVASMFGTVTGGGATINEANLINLTYGHVGTINYAVGARITDVNAGTNNTYILMNMGDGTPPPPGQYGIYGDYNYNNYFGTGNNLIGSIFDNGAKLQSNAVGTEDIIDLRSSFLPKFKVDYRGIIGVNGTLLTAGQSYRVNSLGNAMEPFTPIDGTGLVQRSPASAQSGFINMSGSLQGSSITSNSAILAVGAIAAGTNVSGATGTFTGGLTAASGNFSGNVTSGGAVYSTGSAPSVALGASSTVGTGATVSVVGNNQDGIITIVTGTSLSSGGTLFTVTLNGFSYPNSCVPVVSVNTSFSTANVATAIGACNANTWTAVVGVVTGSAALQPSTTYKFNYHNGGY